jgi:hypothetical protein
LATTRVETTGNWWWALIEMLTLADMRWALLLIVLLLCILALLLSVASLLVGLCT